MDDLVIEDGPKSLNNQGNKFYAAEDFSKALALYNRALGYLHWNKEKLGEQRALRFCILLNRMQALLKIPHATFNDEREELEYEAFRILKHPNELMDLIQSIKAICLISRSYCLECDYQLVKDFLSMQFNYPDNILAEETNQLTLDSMRQQLEGKLKSGCLRVLKSIYETGYICVEDIS